MNNKLKEDLLCMERRHDLRDRNSQIIITIIGKLPRCWPAGRPILLDDTDMTVPAVVAPSPLTEALNEMNGANKWRERQLSAKEDQCGVKQQELNCRMQI